MNRRIRNFKSRTIKKFRQLFKVRALKLDKKWKSGGVVSESNYEGGEYITPTLFIELSNEMLSSVESFHNHTLDAKGIVAFQYSLDSIELLNLKLKQAIEAEKYEQAQAIQNELNRRNND